VGTGILWNSDSIFHALEVHIRPVEIITGDPKNLVERAVILSRDGVLPNPLHKNQTELMIPSLHRPRTFHSSIDLEDSDRALILETLEQAGWIVVDRAAQRGNWD
jgi:hypothetical protein